MAENILITGANRGIGLALCRCFATAGWRVFACCRNPEGAAALQSLANEFGAGVKIFALDVTHPDQIRSLSAELRDEPIDILFNNAGVAGPKGRQEFGNVPVEDWLDVLHVNAIAPLKMAEAFVDQVARSSRKIIANMGSLLGSIADNSSGGLYCYRTSKAALHMVTKSLAIDLAERGITVIVFNPGWVRTDLGGPKAPTTAAESAVGLYRVLLGVGPRDSARFLTFEGKELPW